MRSSTSGSRIVRAIYLLAAGCLAVGVSIEGVARVGFDRVSKIQRRMTDEYRLARTIGTDGSAHSRHVLVVGNSLLDEDVRFDRLRGELGTEWDARRLVVEQTSYFDWYYGLKRLFREGARPDAVVVMLATGNWTATSSRGDYAAQYMIHIADLPDATRDLGLNATQSANLLVSNVSKFWGVRAEMRNFVLGRMMPDLGRLMDFSRVVDSRPFVDDRVAQIVTARIARLKALTTAHNAELIIVLPTVLNAEDGAAGFMRASAAAGVTTLRPVASGAFGADLYRDAGFHLNPKGADEFTGRLVPVLRQRLAAAARQEPTTDQTPGQ